MANPLKLLANLRRFDGTSDPSAYLQTEFRQNLKAIEDAFKNINASFDSTNGTISNVSSTVGKIGEYVESKNSSTDPFTSAGTPFYNKYIDLSPGDWDLSLSVWVFRNAATMASDITAWIGSDPSTGSIYNYYDLTWDVARSLALNEWVLKTSSFRQKIDVTTRYYVTILANYGAGTPTYSHRLSARRMG